MTGLPPPRRRFVGSFISWTERMRVFRADEALEVDSSDRYEIRRRRVFFDEVLLATVHRELGGGPYPWSFASLALLAALLSLAFASEPAALGITLGIAGLFGVLALAGFLLPSWIVTVYGKRARARIRYRLREAKARTLYEEVCQAAAEAQRALAERQSPPPVVEVPLPPEPPYSA
ncbi:MAG TPA: hypothetical protein VKM72_28100 [Thermoanaerobaculia bacterium]|nr:hypothetical protein [Thermoanaerobaculia bacterium]